MSVVAVLACVDVVPDRRLLETDGALVVLAEGDRRPRIHRRELLLPHVVVEPTAVLAHTTGEHKGHGTGSVHEVRVVPMVDPSTDDDHALALGSLGGARPLPSEL